MKSPRTSPFPLQSDAASGCLSGALRRLLCAGAPSSDDVESDVPRMLLRQQKGQHKSPAGPCIVARLMGLDSMPVFPYMTPPPPVPEASLSLSRSRSTSSAESWAGLLGEDAAVRARRTSASFREAPTYLRQENEDFFVLSFAPEDAGSGAPRERNSGMLKKEKNSGQRKKGADKSAAAVAPPSKEAAACRRPSRIEKLEDKVKPPLPPPKQKQSPARKKIPSASERKNNEAGCSSSEDTSPVSVLDYSISFKSSFPPSEEEERKQQRSRRKLSSKFENLSSNSPTTSSHDEPASIRKPSNGDRAERDWSQIWGKICALTEQEAKSSTTWTGREISRSEEASEFAAALAADVLDLILHEEVTAISSCAMDSK